jgi:membrane protein YdbS with pleckstrin-like domain
LGRTKYEEVREMSPLRIIEYILLLVLVVGFGYMTYLSFQWNRAAGIVIPLIVIVLLFMEDRK